MYFFFCDILLEITACILLLAVSQVSFWLTNKIPAEVYRSNYGSQPYLFSHVTMCFQLHIQALLVLLDFLQAAYDMSKLLENIFGSTPAESQYDELDFNHMTAQRLLGEKRYLQSALISHDSYRNLLHSCVFMGTTVVISEILPSLPNLNELVSVFCVNVFKESQLDGVTRWFVFTEDGDGFLHMSEPELESVVLKDQPINDNSSDFRARENSDQATLVDLDTQSKPQTPMHSMGIGASSSKKRTIEARAIVRAPLAVWSRERISYNEALRFKNTALDCDNCNLEMCHDSKGLIDAVDFYKNYEVSLF